ncbi:MAG: hypothetical protein ACKVT2_19595 [Saprospiraceae bacterium]
MNNLRYVLIFALVVLLSIESMAQNLKRIVVKADMLEATKKHLNAAIEWRFAPKNSIEIQLGFRRHNNLPANVFNGDWTANYAKQRAYIISLTSSPPVGDFGWEYLGTGRPLPDAPSPITSLSTLYTRVAYGMSFQTKPRGLRVILLPGISLFRHRYFEVTDKITQNETIFQSWQIGSAPNQEQLVEQTSFYTQTRKMREQNWWAAGANYSFGFAWQAKSGLYLETRLMAGVNIGDGPYEKEALPAMLRNFYGQASFFAGWAF